MGYYMSQLDTEIFISKENFAAALEAVKGLHGQETIDDGGGRHFSWVDDDFYEKESFPEILSCWHWDAELDEAGNLVDLEFSGEKRGDDEILFNAIAPFVADNSYIRMEGEDSEKWEWLFQGGVLKNGYGREEFIHETPINLDRIFDDFEYKPFGTMNLRIGYSSSKSARHRDYCNHLGFTRDFITDLYDHDGGSEYSGDVVLLFPENWLTLQESRLFSSRLEKSKHLKNVSIITTSIEIVTYFNDGYVCTLEN